MPYIDQQTRDRLDGSDRHTNHPMTAGQLTYDLQQCLLRYVTDRGLGYQVLAECIGSLEGAKLDLIVGFDRARVEEIFGVGESLPLTPEQQTVLKQFGGGPPESLRSEEHQRIAVTRRKYTVGG
jgi:hypothetical protein